MSSARFLLLAVMGAMLSGFTPSESGGGGGPAIPTARVWAVQMVPRMVQGTGHVTYTRAGEQMRIRIQANGLPEPYTYEVWLIGPGTWRGTHSDTHELAAAPVVGGKVDVTLSVPVRDLHGWRGIELVHLPSGRPTDQKQVHPALVASFPWPMP